MKTSLLVVVTTDPRVSARPAEGVRIAAGIGAWKKVAVTLYLHGPAVLSLSEFPDELKDEDNFTRYLPIVGEFGNPVYVESGTPFLKELGESAIRHQEIGETELAALAARSTYVIRF